MPELNRKRSVILRPFRDFRLLPKKFWEKSRQNYTVMRVEGTDT
jgi:hypothetical protein